jgi:hypothetical protein
MMFMQKYKPTIVTGVLTSESQWAGVMGNNYTGGSGYPLWYYCMSMNNSAIEYVLIFNHSPSISARRYTEYDNQPNFDNFKAFGGWKEPIMKQYTQDSKDCVDNLNLDYSTKV